MAGFEVDADTVKRNKELVWKYPFLAPRSSLEEYDYAYTWLDEIPEGWRNSFAEQMCEEIIQALDGEGKTDRYILTNIRERYGHLDWRALGSTEKVDEIVQKYEELSKKICVRCGKQATYIQSGWISPYCGNCADELKKYRRFTPIEDYYGGDDG